MKYPLYWDFLSNDIKKIFSSLDLWNIYDQKQLCKLEVVHEKLRLECEEEWKQIIHTKPKLRSYIKFKMKYHTEEYLKMCMTKYQRSLLSQFRAGILPLRIETERFHVKSDTENGNVRHLQVEEWTCQMCNSHETENEFHFLLVYPVYNDYRANLFNSIRV